MSSLVLRSVLATPPIELRFGTSGRRGRLASLTQLEIYINVLGELRYLQSLPAAEGGIVAGDEFFLAHDLRPSSTGWQDGYGEIAQAVDAAVRDAGMRPVHCGAIPTPALACYAWARNRGSIMITGSHIPFDWNGYKLNTSGGELLKHHETPIHREVARVRDELYAQSSDESIFDARGMFKCGHRDLPAASPEARRAYASRYTEFFAGRPLAGMCVVCSTSIPPWVRDLVREILARSRRGTSCRGTQRELRPIDTENIDHQTITGVQALADAAPGIDAVVSTDGDSDRPLIMGVDSGGRAAFFPAIWWELSWPHFLGRTR